MFLFASVLRSVDLLFASSLLTPLLALLPVLTFLSARKTTFPSARTPTTAPAVWESAVVASSSSLHVEAEDLAAAGAAAGAEAAAAVAVVEEDGKQS